MPRDVIDIARRWLRPVLALLVVTALVVPHRGTVFCHMAQRALADSGCCARETVAHAHISDAPSGERPTAARPCCERRGGEALPPVSLERSEKAPVAPALATPHVIAPWPKAESIASLDVAAGVYVGPIVVARGSPPRRGKLRARFGVTIC